MNRAVGRLLPAILLLGTLVVLARSWGPIPPLGSLLDPYHGIWGVARSARTAPSHRATISSLTDSVVIIYDDRAVPHIFARTAGDAQRALGYVAARDRLFQLELQARATAGRLTEWVGPPALASDRGMRRLQLAAAADREYAELLAAADPTLATLQAFADGVNARINELGRADYPLEYHLLDVEPGPWKPVHTLYVLKRMSWTLSFSDHDLQYLRLEAIVGPEAARALLAQNSSIQEPIVPNGLSEPRWISTKLPPPRNPTALAQRGLTNADGLGLGPGQADEPVDGSNNWAVSPSRSSTGSAILAGDPHLSLSLPGIWYEVHMNVPDTMDVYGATLLGTPSVVVGFNRDVAWSFTNNGADVVDYYREIVDDAGHPTATQLDGAPAKVEWQLEEYRNKAGAVIHVDTLYRSHRGPLLYVAGEWLSLRWMALEPSGTYRALEKAADVGDVHQWLDAMTGFDVPSQNGLVADRGGNIAIRSLGRVPIRPPGRYPFIWDGTRRSSDWLGSHPARELPFSLNPAQGYLASANQQPVDPDMDATYWGRQWPTPWRAMRINEALRRDSSVTVDEMRELQTDPSSVRARFFLPYLLDAAHRRPGFTAADSATAILDGWDGKYTLDNETAVLFETVLAQMRLALWDELEDGGGQLIFHPRESIVASLLTDPESVWWDNKATDDREYRDDILVASLVAGFRETNRRYGDRAAGGWRWDRVRRFDIPHLLFLPGLGAREVANQGGPSTLSPMAMGGSHGASWRMVVDLGDTLRAWTTYPGGQSGNPASPYYRNRLSMWSSGELEEVRFPAAPAELPHDQRLSRLVLLPGAPK
ncbi:MAG: penicillin acylase family protein [Gemmatimonadales bacterium]